MKKIFTIFVMLFLLISCGENIENNQSSNETKSNEIEKNNTQQEETKVKDEQKKLNEQVIVTLADKYNTTAKYKDYVVGFVFDITNNTDKEIKGVQGTALFKDMFGKEIMNMGADFTGIKIEPNSTYTESGLVFECNQFKDTNMKLYNTAYDDLLFEYKITAIVFSDGTLETFN